MIEFGIKCGPVGWASDIYKYETVNLKVHEMPGKQQKTWLKQNPRNSVLFSIDFKKKC